MTTENSRTRWPTTLRGGRWRDSDARIRIQSPRAPLRAKRCRASCGSQPVPEGSAPIIRSVDSGVPPAEDGASVAAARRGSGRRSRLILAGRASAWSLIAADRHGGWGTKHLLDSLRRGLCGGEGWLRDGDPRSTGYRTCNHDAAHTPFSLAPSPGAASRKKRDSAQPAHGDLLQPACFQRRSEVTRIRCGTWGGTSGGFSGHPVDTPDLARVLGRGGDVRS